MAFIFPGTKIYRMIHVQNLNSYLKDGRLYSANHYHDTANYIGIHNTDVQDKRGKTALPEMAGKTLLDCVPFYFGVKTPMLFVNKVKNNGKQENIIYFVTTAETVARANYKYFFTDGHAIMQATQWYNDIKDLNKLDWDAINADYWGHANDPTGELKRKKQAEFLVYRFLSWDEIKYIAVQTEKTGKLVQQIMMQFRNPKICRPVYVRPDFYF